MNHWFRLYNTLVDDPKVQQLSDALFKALINLWCIASQNDGILPSADDIGYKLRVKPQKAAELVTLLVRAGLVDNVDGVFIPHNWDSRQFQSDSSTDRVQKHRNKKRNVSGNVSRNAKRNVSETPNGTDREEKTISDTEHSRADARSDLQKRIGDFRQAIVKAFEAANSPTAIETSRAELWLTQGYQEDICLAVIAGIVRKNTSVSTLNYFDNAIKEAHASKAPPRQTFEIANPSEVDWDAICKSYKKFGHWSKQGGNSPDSGNCRCPPEILAKHGLVSASANPDLPPPPLRRMNA